MDAPRGIVFDLEGVLHVGYRPLPGASETLAALDQAGLPHVILTNTTSKTRATISARMGEIGMSYPAERIVTAASATVAFLQRRHAGRRVLLLAEPAAFAEVAAAGGIELVERWQDADVVCLAGRSGPRRRRLRQGPGIRERTPRDGDRQARCGRLPCGAPRAGRARR
jgi:HAD superfamily hydrolase (TIGR01450 family)